MPEWLIAAVYNMPALSPFPALVVDWEAISPIPCKVVVKLRRSNFLATLFLVVLTTLDPRAPSLMT